jgi:hypothetical protein
LGGGWKHQCWCVWANWGKLPKIIWVCRGIGKCIGWNFTIIFLSRKSRIGSNKAHNRNMGSWIYGFRDVQVTFKGMYILRGRGHAIMDCPFMPFHIIAGIVRHVELQNVVGALIDQPHEHE